MGNKYGLTFPQQNIWLVNSLYNSSKINLITGIININKNFNIDFCKKAVNSIIKNNDAMRIKIVLDAETPYQIVREYQYVNIDVIDMQNFNKSEIEKYIYEYKKEDIDILSDKLFEFQILKYSENKGAVLLKMHHIVSDAWSYAKIIEQFVQCYTHLENNEVIDDVNIPSYIEFINTTFEYKNSEKYKKDEEFWTEYLNGFQDKVTLKDRIKKINNTSSRYNVKLDKDINHKIIEYCKENRISPYVMFLAALSTYMYRIKEKNDFVIGTPSLNRANFKEKQMLGMFVSTLPLRVQISENEKFLNLAHNIARNTMSIFRHQKYPYIDTLKNVRNKTNNTNNLYGIILSYQNAKAEFEDKEKYDTKWYENDFQNEDLQIHILDMDSTGVLEVNYDYLNELFDEIEIDYLHIRLMAIIENAILDKDIDVENIEIMSKEEKNKILYEFNDTKTDYPKDKSVIELFEEQVEKTPDNIALVFEDKKLTYQELNEKANSVANYLIEKKQVNRNDIIGIKINRSIEMIIAILGVAKTRAAYLPIDPTFPEERIDYIKNNSKSKFILDDLNEVDFSKKDNPYIKFKLEDPFYILYTSGSTGKPKGVVINNQNILNFVYGINQILNITDKNNVLSITTASFDIFELELWLPILNGSKIILASDEEKYNPYLLNKLCLKNNVDVIQTTTSVYTSLVYDENNNSFIKNIEKLLIGGEKVTSNVVKKIQQLAKAKIFNVYGPTETTIWSSIKLLNGFEKIDAGKPIMNTKMLILDKKSRILPLGVPGELYIAGDGVSKGYLYNKILTDNAFYNILGDRWYSTGDLACIEYDFNLKILDRIDLQVKINGRRIEIEEIENVIYNSGFVENVVVIVKNNKLVCVYKGNVNNKEKLKEHVSKLLPSYMVPSIFYEFENFPMTENKKVDRKKIQLIDFESNKDKIILPQTSTQRYLNDKIISYLNIEKKISINENLFEIGFDSLNIMRLVSDINKKYDITIDSKTIFDNPSIKKIEDIIILLEKNKNSSDKDVAISKLIKKEQYELTDMQKSIYNEYLKDSNSILYNLPFEITIDKKIDVEKLKESIKKCVINHEILFANIIEKENKLYYKINKNIEYNIECLSVNLNEYEEIKNSFVKPFDLNNGPLFRIKMYQINNKIKLLFDFSHIITDGYSITILLSNISRVYNTDNVLKEKISFGECIQLRNITQTDKDFYLKNFNFENNYISNITGTKIKKDINVNTKKGNKIYFDFNKKEIAKYCKKHNITINNLVFGIFNLVLSSISNNNEVILGVTSIGRNLSIDSNTVGMFVNTIPYRVKIDNNLDFLELLRNINLNLISAIKHENYSYLKLLKDLNQNNKVNNFLNIIYTFQNSGLPILELENDKYSISELPTHTSKFDITFEVVENKDSINYNIEYSEAYTKETIEILISILYKVTMYIVTSDVNNIQELSDYVKKNNFLYNVNSDIEKSKKEYNKNSSQIENIDFFDPKEKEILNIYRELLDNQEFGVNDDFFENGGDSLLAMKLVSKLNNIDVNVAYFDLFKYKSVKALYKHIYYEKQYFIDKDVSNYDYSSIEKLLDNQQKLNNLKSKEINCVLLIGSTGFLGMHMLNELYENNVKKVYCFIRQKDDKNIKDRFYDLLKFYFGEEKANKISSIVVLIKADITEVNSIDKALDKYQINEIELVINCAARVKHYGDEIKFMSINVEAVKNLINFCVNYDKELAHMSTLSVSGDFIGGGQKILGVKEIDFSEKSFYINQSLDNIYAYTKFISEKLIYDSIIMRNLKAKVFRVGNLTGRYDDGKFQKNISENAFVNRIITLMKLKIIPNNILDLYIEMTPVDYATKAIFKICKLDITTNVFHIYNYNHIPVNEMLELLKKEGVVVSTIEKQEAKKIISFYLKNNPKLINGIIMDINQDNTLDYHSNIRIESTYTINLLKKIGFRWPKVNNEYFYKFLDYIRKYGDFNN